MLALAPRGSSSASTPSRAGCRRQADVEGVDINLYSIIYELVDNVERALKGFAARLQGRRRGQVEVRQAR